MQHCYHLLPPLLSEQQVLALQPLSPEHAHPPARVGSQRAVRTPASLRLTHPCPHSPVPTALPLSQGGFPGSYLGWAEGCAHLAQGCCQSWAGLASLAASSGPQYAQLRASASPVHHLCLQFWADLVGSCVCVLSQGTLGLDGTLGITGAGGGDSAHPAELASRPCAPPAPLQLP